MSWCAGFSPAFWAAYFEVAPRAPLFEARRELYTLYHILNVRVRFARARVCVWRGGMGGEGPPLPRGARQPRARL